MITEAARLAARTYDLVIVGSGPNGAAVAQQCKLRHPAADVLVVEAGTAISADAGTHLVEVREDYTRRSYEELMRAAKQLAYVQGAADRRVGDPETWTPTNVGIVPAAYFGNDMAQFPGAALSWNVGGMGVHWAAACPWPYGPEVPPPVVGGDWQADLDVARALLQVNPNPYPTNPFTVAVVQALRAALPAAPPERSAQPMPTGGSPDSTGKIGRTGPRKIAPTLFDGTDPSLTLVSGLLCTRVLHRHAAVTGIAVREVSSGLEYEIAAKRVVLATDTLRTPQVLWASGIRPEALGARLNEHASIDGSVVIDDGRLGITDLRVPEQAPDEPFIGAYWSPSCGAGQPTQGQMMERNDPDVGHTIGMGWYVSTEIRAENRLEFSDSDKDALGMPRIAARFAYSDRDLESIEFARKVQRLAAEAVGEFDGPAGALLPPGASLHYTGTVRMGAADDGTSVCDLRGAVWGYRGLFVAGNGVIPTALACNATLTSVALAVRTARFVLD